MSIAENKATLRRLVEAFNRKDLTVIDELFSSDFVLHDANNPDWPRG
jgi:ketosteroid isomerase-like protein